jgi:hypothetical protein
MPSKYKLICNQNNITRPGCSFPENVGVFPSVSTDGLSRLGWKKRNLRDKAKAFPQKFKIGEITNEIPLATKSDLLVVEFSYKGMLRMSQ